MGQAKRVPLAKIGVRPIGKDVAMRAGGGADCNWTPSRLTRPNEACALIAVDKGMSKNIINHTRGNDFTFKLIHSFLARARRSAGARALIERTRLRPSNVGETGRGVRGVLWGM